MDLSIVSAAVSSIAAARELGKAAVALRDFNQVASVVTQLNEQLLNAQEALYRLSAEINTLTQEKFETAQKLRKVEEALAQRGRYSLFQIGRGIYVYKVNVSPEVGEVEDPGGAEPTHYVCQPCFDKGVKSVLQRGEKFGGVYWGCRTCREDFFTDETCPISI